MAPQGYSCLLHTKHVLRLRRDGSIDALAVVCLLLFCLAGSATAYVVLPLSSESRSLPKVPRTLSTPGCPDRRLYRDILRRGASARYPGYPGLSQADASANFRGQVHVPYACPLDDDGLSSPCTSRTVACEVYSVYCLYKVKAACRPIHVPGHIPKAFLHASSEVLDS